MNKDFDLGVFSVQSFDGVVDGTYDIEYGIWSMEYEYLTDEERHK